jgi:hypothetical protein
MDSYPNGTTANGEVIPFAQILGSDHYVETYCQIEDGAGNLLSYQFGVEDGDVKVDRTAQVRRSCDLTVTPFGAPGQIIDSTVLEQLAETLIPADGKDVFAPYGNKIRIFYGIRIPGYTNPSDGTAMYKWSLGLFRLSTVDISDDGVPTMSITGYDDSRTISRNKLTLPWIVAAGTNYGDAMIALCQDRCPGLKALPHTVTPVTPQLVVDQESDPWKVVTEWAASVGSEIYINRNGELVIRDEPDPAENPIDWTYDDGTTNKNATLLSLNRGMSDDPGYNGIVLLSESNTLQFPIRVELWDDDPDSPTYALGQYGKVPQFQSSPLITDPTQAGIMATAELLKALGATETLDFAVIPNPAHEAGDLVRVIRPLSRTDSVSILESFSIPLSVTQSMPIRTRERRSSAQISGGLL